MDDFDREQQARSQMRAAAMERLCREERPVSFCDRIPMRVMPRSLKILLVVPCMFVILVHLLGDMSRNTVELYAYRTVLGLERYRQEALASDASHAARTLYYVNAGENTKQSPGSYLDRICSLQRTNVIRDIIAHLRAKTGEDLGDLPGPWIQKYSPTDSIAAEPGGPANRSQPVGPEPNRTSAAAGSGG